MCCVWNPKRTLITLVLLAMTKSPLSSLNIVISGYVTSPVSKTISHIPVLAGSDATMPCETQPPIKNDSLLIVVWYRDDNPVYSYDTRLSGLSAHWVEDPFIGRAHWHNTPTSGLRMRDVQPTDRAIYRCRVDFYVSQTKNYRIALDVIELPKTPVIFDEYGKEVSEIAGPYHEGGEFKLICTVNGGYPTPKVRWLQGDTVFASLGNMEWKFTEEYQASRSLTLAIKNVTREYLMSSFTCNADNTLLAPPLKTSIRVDLYLKPLSVEISSREQPISVGMKTELLCKSVGARPPAVLSWWLGGKKLEAPLKEMGSKEMTGSESLLQWMPLKEHNGQVLTCRAEHPKFNSSSIESKLQLNVYYMPDVRIHLGDKVNPNDIEEGDDVYFGCNVDANPPAYKVVWEHNGAHLQHSPANGIIITGNTNLALRNVSRTQAGFYSCIASNVEGDGRSQDLHMQIVYKPLCKKKDLSIIGVALQESTSVLCEVDAFPPPNTFEWTLNSSSGSVKVDFDRFTVESPNGRSVLSFAPMSTVDYGLLACYASNLAGKQLSPCVYTLLPATIPDPPRNCSVYNFTDDSLQLSCLPGYDGGLHTTYVVEVWVNEFMVKNASSEAAVWGLQRLGASVKLRLIIYAINARGKSDYVSFAVETAPKLSSRTTSQNSWQMDWMIGVLFGAALIVLLVGCLVIVAIKARKGTTDYEAPALTDQKVIVQKRNSPQNSDDKNPDLIPLSKGVVEGPPDPPEYSAIVEKSQVKSSNSAHSLARSQALTVPTTTHSHFNESQADFGRSIQSGARIHREIVTTRTPLLSAQQESCV